LSKAGPRHAIPAHNSDVRCWARRALRPWRAGRSGRSGGAASACGTGRPRRPRIALRSWWPLLSATRNDKANRCGTQEPRNGHEKYPSAIVMQQRAPPTLGRKLRRSSPPRLNVGPCTKVRPEPITGRGA
jgi:hypothetical protein